MRNIILGILIIPALLAGIMLVQFAHATTEIRNGGDSCISFTNKEDATGVGCTNGVNDDGNNNGNQDVGTSEQKKSCRASGEFKCSSSQTGNGEFGNIYKNPANDHKTD